MLPFTDKETDVEGLSGSSKTTKLINGRARMRVSAGQLQILHFWKSWVLKGAHPHVIPQLVETQTLVFHISVLKRNGASWKNFWGPQSVAATFVCLLASCLTPPPSICNQEGKLARENHPRGHVTDRMCCPLAGSCGKTWWTSQQWWML